MSIKNWDIVITKDTRAVARDNFGKVLILATNKEQEFTEYEGLEELVEDFAESEEVYKMAKAIFSQTPRPFNIAVAGLSNTMGSAEDMTEFLDTVKQYFYYLVCDDNTETAIKALSEWVEDKQKLYGFSTDSETIAGELKALDYERTFCVVHEDPDSYPCEAWIGRCAAEDAGSITWNYKELKGIKASNKDISMVDADNANLIINQHGINHTHDGRVVNGEWIDIIVSQDYLYTKIDESVFKTLVKAEKVPYTNTGISMIEAAVEAPIKQAANAGLIAEEDGEFLYTVTTPTRSETTVINRANRFLPDVQIEITLAGAIHGGKISILLQV